MSDNRYYVQLEIRPAIARRLRRFARQETLKLGPELVQQCFPLWGRVHNFRFVLEDFAAVLRCKHADSFPHLPTRRSQDLETLRIGLNHRHNLAAAHAESVRISLKCVQIETCGVKSLEDFG